MSDGALSLQILAHALIFAHPVVAQLAEYDGRLHECAGAHNELNGSETGTNSLKVSK